MVLLTRWAVVLCSIGVGGGCATRGAAHVAVDESRPHISWEIGTGGDTGDADFVCGSAQPGRPCVLAASAPGTRTMSTIRLFVHAAAQPTSYLGFMRAPFFQGELDRKLGEVNATVEPDSRPVGSTVIGQVTSKPGTYTFIISVDATQYGDPNPVRIAEAVPVVLKGGPQPLKKPVKAEKAVQSFTF
jgi:hypothetical protein